MEIKFKLFTTIAQALDKLKKQFDKTDKSLVKTQTTLDETIVNIDNVIDSVARTMTEALDPYFVDMIYGYIDDNGKFKLGVIKDPYTHASPTDQSNIIPTNATKIYHYGDKDFIENITTLKLFINTPNLIFDNLDFLKLFPKLTGISNINCDYIKELTLYGNISYASMHISRIDTLIINGFENAIPTFYDTKINNLKLIDTIKFHYSSRTGGYFAFESSNDIEGWDNLTELYYTKSTNSADSLIEFVIHSNLKKVTLEGSMYVILEGTDKTILLNRVIKLKIDNLDNYLTHTFNDMLLANQCEIIIDNVIFNGTLDLSGRNNIPTFAFKNFPITKLIISDTITSIGFDAFKRNYLLELHISSLYTFLHSIQSNRIFNIEIGTDITSTDLYVSNVLTRDIIIPDGITSISSRLFERFNIDSIDCGNVMNIGDRAFADSTLSSINLRNVESLGAYIFNNLHLKKLIIPESITSLKNYVLDNLIVDVLVFEKNLNYINMQRNLNISKIYIKYNGIVYIKSLSYISVDIIYVPIVHVDSYKSNDNWSKYADKIFPYDFELNPDNI